MSRKKKASKKSSNKEMDLPLCGLPNVPVRKLDSDLDAGRAFLIRHIEKNG